MRRYKKISLALITVSILTTGMLASKSDAYTTRNQRVRSESVRGLDDYRMAEGIDINLTSGRNPKDTHDRNIQMAEELAKKMKDYPSRIDISELFNKSGGTIDSFQKNVVAYLEYADPDMYAFRGKCIYRYYSDVRTGKITSVIMENIAYEETRAETDKVKVEVDSIVSRIPSDMTNAEKVFWVNNYLVTNAVYDDEAAQNVRTSEQLVAQGRYTHAFTPYGVLLDKKGVCESYAKAFSMIMKRLNIPCYRVRNHSIQHTWNLVNLDGKWYNIDVTWNDPSKQMDNKVSYRFFLKSDEQMLKNSEGSRTPHLKAEEDIAIANNTDRDSNLFENKLVNSPEIVNKKFYFFAPTALNHMDGTNDIKEYNVNTNGIKTLIEKVEGNGYRDGNDKYVFKFDKGSKKVDMYSINDLNNPVASTLVPNLSNLDRLLFNNRHVDMSNFKVEQANKNSDSIILNLKEWSYDYMSYVPSRYNIRLNIGRVESGDTANQPQDNSVYETASRRDSDVENPRYVEPRRNQFDNIENPYTLVDIFNSTRDRRIQNAVIARLRSMGYGNSIEYRYEEVYQ